MITRSIINYWEQIAIYIDSFYDHNSKNDQSKVFVLTFHSVHSERDKKHISTYLDIGSSICINDLELFVDYFLGKGVSFINSRNLLDKNLSKINILLSFDDGYYNNHLLLDLIAKYNIPVEIFVSTYFVETQKMFWWDILYNVKQNPESLKKLDSFEIIKISEKLFREDMYSDINRPFSKKELIEFSTNKNVLIGNHTNFHTICNEINRGTFFDDVVIAQEKLTSWLNYKPISFAFPNGDLLKGYEDINNKLAKEGLLFNYVVYPNYFESNKFLNLQSIPRFMFNPHKKLIRKVDAVLKDNFMLNTLKSMYFIRKTLLRS
jgi:peptidoglycan/xylan/chitin deacetylase (PgdA/CDA1 family)